MNIMTAPLSRFFSWEEACITSHRQFDNEIPAELYPAIKNTAANMDRVRILLGYPITVNSWYRSPALNSALGSNNQTSEHPKGLAVDFICPRYGSPLEICKALISPTAGVYFNQLIYEHTWVHISFTVPPAVPKMQVLTLLQNRKYAVGLTDKLGVPVK
jgi:hypothetical protein